MQPPEYLETYSIVTRVIMLVLLFGGLGLAMARSPLSFNKALKSWIAVFVIVLVWFGVVFYLAKDGVFEAGSTTIPIIPFAILIPIIVGLWLLMRSETVAIVIDTTPLSWLVGLQVYRVIGGIFVVLWIGGLLPGQFAIPAGIGDVLVGVLAAVVAAMLAGGVRGARGSAIGWNLIGILDLVVAVATGFLSSPGPLQVLALDQPNVLTTAYPLVLIPAFAVPLSLILHGLCLWKIHRITRVEPVPSLQGAPIQA